MSGLRTARIFTIPALLLAMVLVAPTGPAAPGPADASLSGKLVPADAALFGAWVKPRSGSSSSGAIKGAITNRERQLGRQFDIDQAYYPWGKAFPTWKERWDVHVGRIPLISWAAVNTTSVNQGQYDNYIRARADGIRALGAPVFIRWFSEMEAAYQQQKSVSPAAYIAAWRRIVRIFRNRGATNVVWVWCGTAAGFRDGAAQKYYPGTDWVDWVCADGFNWAPRNPGSTWTSFADIFRGFYNWGSTTGKPLMIAETGTEEGGVAGKKAQWVLSARDVLKTSYRNIKAFVYFDTRAPDAYGTYYNWWMDTSASSLQAFVTMAQDPYFRWNRFYRPDLHITAKRGTAGDDVYEGNQTVVQRLSRKGRARFTVRVQNDGNIGDVYRVSGGTRGKRLKVRYRMDGADVTDEIRAGSFLTPELEPGQSISIAVQVRAKRGKIGKAIDLVATSGSDRKVGDSVVGKVRRGKFKKRR